MDNSISNGSPSQEGNVGREDSQGAVRGKCRKSRARLSHVIEPFTKGSKEPRAITRHQSITAGPETGIVNLRRFFNDKYDSPREAFKAMDPCGSGQISFSDLQAGFERLNISPWEATGGVDIFVIFSLLDYDESSTLTCHKLLKSTAAERKKQRKQSKAAPRQNIKVTPKRIPSPKDFCTRRRGNVLQVAPEEGTWPPETWIGKDSTAMRKIAAFAKDTEEELLDLQYAFIGEKGTGQLVDAINSSPGMRTMTELQLWGNYIGSAGTCILAAALEAKIALQKLNLGWNGIGDQGAIRLATTVLKIEVLEELNLGHNRIGNDGAIHFAQSLLRLPPALTKLELSYNSIGKQGMKELKQAISVEDSKVILHLQGNTEKTAEEHGMSEPKSKKKAYGLSGASPWTCDIAHPLRKVSSAPTLNPPPSATDQRMLLYAGRGLQELTAPESASRYIPGTTVETWPAAKELTQALADGALVGQGRLPSRPSSQGTLHPSLMRLDRQQPGDPSGSSNWALPRRALMDRTLDLRDLPQSAGHNGHGPKMWGHISTMDLTDPG